MTKDPDITDVLRKKNAFLDKMLSEYEAKQEKTMEKVEFLLQTLRDIEEVGTRPVYQSFEGDNGWEKKLVKIDRSIEAEMAHDALASFQQWGEYV
jgi:predicted ribosome quality control (RQC) complex YloA/Tae2 family protein